MAKARKTAKPQVDQLEEMTVKAQQSFTENFEKMSENFANIGEFGKDNMEALTTAASTYAKGVEELVQENADFAKTAMENGVEQMQAIASVKSPQEFLELQTAWMRDTFQRNIAQATAMTEKMTSLAKESANPLTERYSEVVEQAQTLRA